jgi:hypothetical protein
MKSEFNIKAGLATWLFLVAVIFITDQLKIDSCLDTGNAFNYVIFKCSEIAQPAGEPYLESRYPRYISITALVFLFFYIRGYVCSGKGVK